MMLRVTDRRDDAATVPQAPSSSTTCTSYKKDWFICASAFDTCKMMTTSITALSPPFDIPSNRSKLVISPALLLFNSVKQDLVILGAALARANKWQDLPSRKGTRRLPKPIFRYSSLALPSRLTGETNTSKRVPKLARNCTRTFHPGGGLPDASAITQITRSGRTALPISPSRSPFLLHKCQATIRQTSAR
jgi:hypothetical protein